MDSFTVAPELKGTKGDIIAARIEVPILIVMIYGIVGFTRLGWSQDHYLYTYAPVLGGVAASVGLFTYFFRVSRFSFFNLIVQLGTVTEHLNRHWYERNTGQVVTEVQRQVFHPIKRWMAATLDGVVEATGAVFEAKFMLPW